MNTLYKLKGFGGDSEEPEDEEASICDERLLLKGQPK